MNRSELEKEAGSDLGAYVGDVLRRIAPSASSPLPPPPYPEPPQRSGPPKVWVGVGLGVMGTLTAAGLLSVAGAVEERNNAMHGQGSVGAANSKLGLGYGLLGAGAIVGAATLGMTIAF